MNSCKTWDKEALTNNSCGKQNNFFATFMVQVTSTLEMKPDVLFSKKIKPEALPPTSDVANLHIRRAHFQAMIWKQTESPHQDLPSPTDFEWELSGDRLKPILMTAEAIPTASLEMIFCGCNTRCRNKRCRCRKANLPCTAFCKCKSATEDDTCLNDEHDVLHQLTPARILKYF